MLSNSHPASKVSHLRRFMILLSARICTIRDETEGHSASTQPQGQSKKNLTTADEEQGHDHFLVEGFSRQLGLCQRHLFYMIPEIGSADYPCPRMGFALQISYLFSVRTVSM